MRINNETFCFGCRSNKAPQEDQDVCLMMDSEKCFELMFDTSWHQLNMYIILGLVKEDIKKRLQKDSESVSV